MVWDHEVGGSSPLTPTIKKDSGPLGPVTFLVVGEDENRRFGHRASEKVNKLACSFLSER